MRELIQRAHVVTQHTYGLFFERIALAGAGYSFPCTENGSIIHRELNECSVESLGHCIDNVGRIFHTPEVSHYTNRYWEPTILKCDCGRAKVTVHVTPGAYNYGECDECGATYNMSGQRLTSPSTWMPDDMEGDPERPDCDAYSEN